MTAQVEDSLSYRGERHAVVGIGGQGWFEPSEHGIRCVPMNTACWRGYVASYAVEEGELRLASLLLQHAESAPPQLFGAAPTWTNEHGQARYTDLAVRVPFTGGLLVAQDFIRALYVHMGFHPAWKYGVVHELSFEDGRLVGEVDRSEAMATIRARLAAKPLGPDGTDREELRRWIEQAFDRSYV